MTGNETMYLVLMSLPFGAVAGLSISVFLHWIKVD